MFVSLERWNIYNYTVLWEKKYFYIFIFLHTYPCKKNCRCSINKSFCYSFIISTVCQYYDIQDHFYWSHIVAINPCKCIYIYRMQTSYFFQVLKLYPSIPVITLKVYNNTVILNISSFTVQSLGIVSAFEIRLKAIPC